MTRNTRMQVDTNQPRALPAEPMPGRRFLLVSNPADSTGTLTISLSPKVEQGEGEMVGPGETALFGAGVVYAVADIVMEIDVTEIDSDTFQIASLA